MKYTILKKEDIDRIIKLEQEDFTDGWNNVMLNDAFDSGRFFALGVFDKERLVSFVTFSISVDTADIEGVCTDKAYRRKGFAFGLIKEVEKFLINKNIKKLFLEVREQNSMAIALYIKSGFKQISKRQKYYSDGENAIVFCKEI